MKNCFRFGFWNASIWQRIRSFFRIGEVFLFLDNCLTHRVMAVVAYDYKLFNNDIQNICHTYEELNHDWNVPLSNIISILAKYTLTYYITWTFITQISSNRFFKGKLRRGCDRHKFFPSKVPPTQIIKLIFFL